MPGFLEQGIIGEANVMDSWDGRGNKMERLPKQVIVRIAKAIGFLGLLEQWKVGMGLSKPDGCWGSLKP